MKKRVRAQQKQQQQAEKKMELAQAREAINQLSDAMTEMNITVEINDSQAKDIIKLLQQARGQLPMSSTAQEKHVHASTSASAERSTSEHCHATG